MRAAFGEGRSWEVEDSGSRVGLVGQNQHQMREIRGDHSYL